MLAKKGIDFYALQIGKNADQLAAFRDRVNVRRVLGDDVDLLATASLIERMDLVITVDTMVAHLAGALGKPVWLMLYYPGDWRWMMNRADSPWYPTMRIFRMGPDGDWTPVLRRLARQLDHMSAAHPEVCG